MLNIDVISNHLKVGNLSFNAKALEKYTQLTPANIFITRDRFLERERVENFIHNVFYNAYGAVIDSYYPTLMSVHDIKDDIFAAVGYRFAEEETLFLEQYVEHSIEEIASEVFNKRINRDSIVEVGNLAATGVGAPIFLFVALNGPGIDDEHVQHILDPFYRVLTTSNISGAGLRLSIVKWISEELNINIEVTKGLDNKGLGLKLVFLSA